MEVSSLFLFVFLFPVLCGSTALPEWHMKPLGSHIAPSKVDETFADNLISPQDFAEKYVLPRKPLVFRGIVKDWPAYKLWSDEYLSENYGEMELRLEGKKEKASAMPKGDVCLGRDRMKTFLNDYRKGANKYVVSDLPFSMYHEVKLPGTMSCGEYLDNFVEIDLWMNSDMGVKGKGGNSLLHKDAFNTLNCVVNGTKEWKLIELQYNDYVYQSWEGPMDAGYGGFSVMNVDKVNAKKFPDVGKIPKWQFTTINAGDCIHLPSQMWHQVKSYGETNRAIAFLFSQFNGRKNLNFTSCPEKPEAMNLKDVDVDHPYSGSGIMPMGNSEIPAIRDENLPTLIDRKLGHITKRRTYRAVYGGHESGAKHKKLMLDKATALYEYMIKIAGGKKTDVTMEFVMKMTKAQIRPIFKWLFPIEPANSYVHEYSIFEPEEITSMIEEIHKRNGGKIQKDVLMDQYQNRGGTLKFAEDLWTRLAGEATEITDYEPTLAKALELYEYHRRGDPDAPNVDDDATITTPQGHKSQPKKVKGGYTANEEDDDEDEQQSNEKSEPNEEERNENEPGDDEEEELQSNNAEKEEL